MSYNTSMSVPSRTQPPKLVIFDFDGTLSANNQPVERLMATKLSQLLERLPIGIVSEGDLGHLLKMAVARLPESAQFTNLHLLPASGGALYHFENGGWEKVFDETISEKDAPYIEKALKEGAKATETIPEDSWGERIERRGSRIALLALGADAPFSERYAWDSNKSKRAALLNAVAARLPEGYRAENAGAATIAVAKEGIDRAYGVAHLCRRLRISESDALYIGDQLYGDGDDESVLRTNAQVHAIQTPTDTARAIVSLLAAL